MSSYSMPRDPCIAVEASQVGFATCASVLLAAVFLQKLALPGTDGRFPLNLAVFPTIVIAAFALRVLELDFRALACYVLFLFAAALSFVSSSSPRVSALSLGFLLAVQFPLAFKFSDAGPCYRRLLHLLSMIGCLCAVLGVLQFAAQFVVGSRLAFFLDTGLPDSVMLKGYDSLIPLFWTSPVYKSNGIFFLEPSLFCQFLALAIVAELLVGARVLRLLILGAGLFTSYSGTGLTMLALFVPAHFLRRGFVRNESVKVLLVIGIACAALIYFGRSVSFDAFTSRLDEFNDVHSSGWGRFVSMFVVLPEVLFVDGLTFLIGRGPGTVTEYFDKFPFGAFDPTWGKLVYEYGLIGASIYGAFFYFAFCKGARGLRFAMGYTYFFLGGYLLNASLVMQVASLVAWFDDNATWEAAAAKDYRGSH
jgi:hypothetical protein